MDLPIHISSLYPATSTTIGMHNMRAAASLSIPQKVACKPKAENYIPAHSGLHMCPQIKDYSSGQLPTHFVPNLPTIPKFHVVSRSKCLRVCLHLQLMELANHMEWAFCDSINSATQKSFWRQCACPPLPFSLVPSLQISTTILLRDGKSTKYYEQVPKI